MPIDYSKFDSIVDSDEEEDTTKDRRLAENAEALHKCLRELGGAKASQASDASFAPCPPPAEDDLLDPWCDQEATDAFASRPLDLEVLQQEAWLLLVGRLVTRPGSAAGIARDLLLEAELHLMSSRYREALTAAFALSMTAASPPEAWAAPALVVEMVASYQLGDRDRAVGVGDRLKAMDRSTLSQHLQVRYKGTVDVLELVPQFLSLLKSKESEKAAGEEF
eukprot:gnl/TRDRNA2_/TRDRNA2_197266_c0_seq1.p1 gnl/TRDRNA2_/TRDRNA2_197266_c0~~gnl/TRDRNA2_/TRDRNA2_197266_c0_seq1.p1  ORF type:complete len:222 (+),score=64.46 gnl/TRDRNA2_/TRDRNA2_197266_c0_seq1:83-748(+)